MPRLSPAPLLLALSLLACKGGDQGKPPGAQAERAPVVRVRKLDVRSVRREIDTTGFLESEHQVVVYSKIQGRVIEAPFDEGATVKAGQVLARLDAREGEASVRQAEVLLEDRKVRRELQKLEVDSSQRRVVQAKNDRTRLEAEWKRFADMDASLISPKTLEDARYAFENAIEALSVAEFNAKKAVLDEKAAENLIHELEARLDDARIKLQEHEVKAPLDGVISKRGIRGGETIGAATELFVVTDLDNIVCHLARPQRELPLLAGAKEVKFSADGLPGAEFTADLDLISPCVEQATGSFRARFRVRKDDARKLKPGMFVRAKILTEQLRDALMAPKAAVLADGDASCVMCVRGGVARKVLFEPGLQERDFVEVRPRGDDALTLQDLVIVSGHQDLRDQVAVEVQRDPRDQREPSAQLAAGGPDSRPTPEQKPAGAAK